MYVYCRSLLATVQNVITNYYTNIIENELIQVIFQLPLCVYSSMLQNMSATVTA